MGQIDQEEFARLYEEAYPRLWTIAAAILGDRDRAQDLVQEAAIVGLRRLETYEPGSDFPAWMGQIVRFSALNARKSVQQRKFQAVDGHVLEQTVVGGAESEVVSPSGLLSQDQGAFDDEVTQAIGALEPVRRACLLLRVVHHLSYTEIAEQLDLPEGTAMSHVHRARAALRRDLSDSAEGGHTDA